MPNIFIDGMRISKPNEKAPEFIKLNISIKVDDFIAFAKQHAVKGWLNIDVKKSQKGVLYSALNTYQKKDEGVDEEAKDDTTPLSEIDFPL